MGKNNRERKWIKKDSVKEGRVERGWKNEDVIKAGWNKSLPASWKKILVTLAARVSASPEFKTCLRTRPHSIE